MAAISDAVGDGGLPDSPVLFAFFFSFPLTYFLAFLSGLMLAAQEVVLYKWNIGKCVTLLRLQNRVNAAFWGDGAL